MNRTIKPQYSPVVQQLKSLVSTNWTLPENACDEVYPGIIIGNAMVAKNIKALSHLGVTHIINAACGVDSLRFVDTSELFYLARSYKCKFLGIPATDVPNFQLHRYFNETSTFIDDAVSNGDGKVYVHCIQGISRSATLVIAYLMIKKGMTVFEAVKTVRGKRNIFPNEGFLQQLYDLDSYHSALQQSQFSLQ